MCCESVQIVCVAVCHCDLWKCSNCVCSCVSWKCSNWVCSWALWTWSGKMVFRFGKSVTFFQQKSCSGQEQFLQMKLRKRYVHADGFSMSEWMWDSDCVISGSAGVPCQWAAQVLQDGWPREGHPRSLRGRHGADCPRRGQHCSPVLRPHHAWGKLSRSTVQFLGGMSLLSWLLLIAFI